MISPPVKPWIPEHGPAEIVLTNATVVDVIEGKLLKGRYVHLKDGKFASITETSPSSTMTCTVDVKGKYIIPGLIDCHVHLCAVPGESRIQDLWAAHPDAIAYRTAWLAKQMLRGFTTARDAAGATLPLRDAIAEGLVIGPRLFIAGKALSQTGGHGDLRLPYQGASFKCCGSREPGIARVCDGVPACLESARDELRQGADFLKIMSGGGVASPTDPLEMIQFTAEEILAITTSAKNLGKYATAHAYTNEAIRHAVGNGATGIEHGNFIDEETTKMCAEKGVFITPTLTTHQALLRPPYDQFLPESGRLKRQEVIDRGLGALKIMQNAGVSICFGRDSLAGMHVFQNEEFKIRAGVMSSIDVLRSATTVAAKLLRMEGKLGVVAEGVFADLLILDQNPLEDVTILSNMDDN